MRRVVVGTNLAVVGLFLISQPFTTEMPLIPEGIGAFCVGAGVAAVLFERRAWLLAGLGGILGLVLAGSWIPSAWLGSVAAGTVAAALVLRRGCLPSAATLLVVVAMPFGMTNFESVPWLARANTELDAWARSASQALAIAPRAPAFGFAYLGGWWLVPSLLGAVTCLRQGTRRLLVAAGILAGWGLGWLVSQLIIRSATGELPVQCVPVLCGAGTIGIVLYFAHGRGATFARLPWPSALAVAVLAVSSGMKASAEFAGSPLGPRARTGILTVGLQDWGVPHHGEYGAWVGGMFGLLPKYAEAFGDNIVLLGKKDVQPEALSSLDVLILINLNEDIGDAAREAIDGFILRGGTCLIFADHTDVAGLMGPTNQLAGRYGLRVRFDSAKELAPWWRSGITSGWPIIPSAPEPGYFPYGVGASVEVSGEAVPLLKAAHGFSDVGYKHNLPGAFLGNYAVDAGERVGGIVLAGGARCGSGACILVGDTTPIQNALVETSYFRSVRRLLSTRCGAFPGLLALFLCLAGVALGSVVLRFPSPALAALAALPIGLAVTSPWFRPGRLDPPVHRDAKAPVAVIIRRKPTDISPGKLLWRGDWPLSRSAARAGLLTYEVDAIRDDDLMAADVVAIPLPLAPVEGQRRLVEYIRAGGEVLFVGGPRHAQAVDTLLAEAHVRIRPVALGPLPLLALEGRSLETPHLASAYELELLNGGEWTPIFTDSGRVFAARAAIGRGHLTLIADEAFLYADNVEGQDQWELGNIAFLDRIWSLARRPVR